MPAILCPMRHVSADQQETTGRGAWEPATPEFHRAGLGREVLSFWVTCYWRRTKSRRMREAHKFLLRETPCGVSALRVRLIIPAPGWQAVSPA